MNVALPLPQRQTLLWGATALAAGAAAAAGAAPVLILSLALLVACAVGVLHNPLVFLWIITALSGLGLGWTDSAAFELAGRSINVNGLRWAIVMAACALILVRTRRLGMPRVFRAYAAFLLLAAVGVSWSLDPFEGVKQLLLFVAPLLVAVVIAQTVKNFEDIRLLRFAIVVAAAVGAVVGLVPALAGDVLGGSFDPEGRPLHRAFGTFLLPVVALTLARLRYSGARYTFALAVLFALVLATVSRVTVATFLVLVLVTTFGSTLRLRAAAVTLIALFGLAAFTFEPLRDRLFADPRRGFSATLEITGSGDDARLDVAGLQLSGRGMAWLQTWAHARQAPLLGHGTGSATRFLAERTGGAALYPHNEYLRIFHDLGAVGLLVLWAVFGVPIVAFTRMRRAATSRITAELALAATLCWIAFALIALFDNPLGYYVFLTHNVFLISTLALRARQLEPVRAREGDA